MSPPLLFGPAVWAGAYALAAALYTATAPLGLSVSDAIDVLWAIGAVTVGLAAGVIRERTGSATIPIIVHAAQNLTIVVLSYMATGWNVPSLFQA